MAVAAVAEAVEQKTKEYAKSVEKKLKALTVDLAPKYWEMAELIADIHDKNVWQILGYKTVELYREEFFISNGTWYEKRKLWTEFMAIALKDDLLTRAQMKRMPSQNVKQLLRLDLKRRFNSKWITKALTMKEGELTAQVDHVLNNESEPEEGLGAPESQVVIKWRCTTSQKEAVLETIRYFCEKNGLPLDAEVQALVLLLADWKSGN